MARAGYVRPRERSGPGGASLAVAVVLALLTAAAHLPVLDASFVNFDDNVVVSENPHIRTLSWETVRWAATTDLAGYAIPVTWLSHALDYRLFGLDARGH